MKKFLFILALLFRGAQLIAAEQETASLLTSYVEIDENECGICNECLEGERFDVVVEPCRTKANPHSLCNICLESVIAKQRALRDFKGLQCPQCTVPFRDNNKKNIGRLVAGKPYAANLFAKPKKSTKSSSLLCCCFRAEG